MSEINPDRVSQLHDLNEIKLLCFSTLFIERFELNKRANALFIKSEYVFFELSYFGNMFDDFFPECLIGGEIAVRLGDAIAVFSVAGIQALPEPEITDVMRFKTISPVSVHASRGDERSEHISPESSEYENAILMNLINKYSRIHKTEFSGDRKLEIDVQGAIKAKLIKIKNFSNKCFDYRFTMYAPVELMKIAYCCGIGGNNAMGCGMLKEI
jgi:CRISPR-associated endoribonuclease Cas6